ncbi:MAG: phytochrome, partial [Sphingomonas sp.]
MASHGITTDPALDITACDREPIHIPGSIQPHGLLLIADARTGTVVAGAGDLEARWGDAWQGASLSDLLAQDIAALFAQAEAGPGGTVVAKPVDLAGERLDVAIHRAGERLLVELEPAGATPMGATEALALLSG